MKNHQPVKIFLRLVQCVTLTVIVFVVVAGAFGQNKDAPNTNAAPPKDTPQKEPPPNAKVDMKHLPIAGP